MAQIVANSASATCPRSIVHQRLEELLHSSDGTVRLLYLGNSRVARPIGFAFDGFEEIAFDRGRLAGNAFVVPRKGAGQTLQDPRYLFNAGPSMSPSSSWTADSEVEILHAHKWPGLLLDPTRTVKMANLGNDLVLLPRDQPVTLTVQYLVGPSYGSFSVVPIEVLGDNEIIHTHPSAVIDTNAPDMALSWQRITLPAMIDPTLNRSFTLEGLTGDSVVYRVNVDLNVANGIAVSEMAIGAEGYQTQADEQNVPPETWTEYAAAFGPTIAIWQYAANQGANGLVEATMELMDRVESVNPDVLHILTIDNPTPRRDSKQIVAASIVWANALDGYEGAIVVDPAPFLPQDFIDLQGTGKLGRYFLGPIHENRYGARVVANALWDAMEDYLASNPPNPADLDGDGNVGASDLLMLLAAWGTDPGGPPDFDGDGNVGAEDLLVLLANWGPCP
ncbi:MAG: hypothetical protein V3T53_10625 [Phycisphaerales bacterium]